MLHRSNKTHDVASVDVHLKYVCVDGGDDWLLAEIST
jgi:hypothetical protein